MLVLEFSSLFKEFALLLAIAVAAGYIGQLLRQPLIVSFIAAGVLIGPPVLGLIEHNMAMELLAEFGIALLLFVVGLKLDINLIRALGAVALATGLGQITFTSVLVFLICQLLGLELVHSLYIAAAMSFSSTIIIVKLLSDKREIDTLHGRIAIGFLIVQDLMVVLVMILITAFGAAGQERHFSLEVVNVLVKGGALLLSVVLLMRYVLPWLLPRMARSAELLVLFAIALAVNMAAISDLIGFSKEVGAFLGGIALASTPFRDAVGSRLVSVRDFLLLFFFLSLGSQLDVQELGQQIPLALMLSLFVLIGNPMIVMAIMGFMKFRRRTGFMAGLAVAQISEFSLIMAALGLSSGHISSDVVGLITLVALTTIACSTYMILYAQWIYDRLSPLLRIFERRLTDREDRLRATSGTDKTDIIVFGLGRYGSQVAEGLAREGFQVLGVDQDPSLISRWPNGEVFVRFGDAEDPELLAGLPLSGTQWVVSTLPDKTLNLILLDGLQSEGYSGQIAVTTHHAGARHHLESSGSHMVLLPFDYAAEQTVQRLCAAMRQETSGTLKVE